MIETFTCPRCGTESDNPLDVADGYCAACNDWTAEGPLSQYQRDHPMYFDPDGNPIPLRRWVELNIERDSGRWTGWRVAHTDITPDVRVSTVWLGIDAFGFGPPLIYETMVFGGPLHLEGERHPTREAAQAGHERWVAAARAGDVDGG